MTKAAGVEATNDLGLSEGRVDKRDGSTFWAVWNTSEIVRYVYAMDQTIILTVISCQQLSLYNTMSNTVS